MHGHLLVALNSERPIAYGSIAEAIAVGLHGAELIKYSPPPTVPPPQGS
jgi:hypothetical protein